MRRLGVPLLLALGLAACARQDAKLGLALNWKPGPEFGGIFEAERLGSFAKRDVEVARTGGPGAPVVQMVTAKQVSFGIASADASHGGRQSSPQQWIGGLRIPERRRILDRRRQGAPSSR